VYALLFVRFEWGGPAAYVLAGLPALLAYVVAGSWYAAAFMVMLPMYFVIGQATSAWPHYEPYVALDHAMPLAPAWIGIYGSLYMCGFILPLVVVRGRELFEQTLKAYLFVMTVSYLVFLIYPTTAPRSDAVLVNSFATWSLQLFYDLDQPYGCFPSLHVAYSFVGALACYRMHAGVGVIAAAWAVLIGLSTVYTKQHFVVDALTGAALGAGAYAMFLRDRPFVAVADDDRRMAPTRSLYVVGAYSVIAFAFWIAYRLGLGPASS
jgi:membrane-associated phospholipid phosphatase